MNKILISFLLVGILAISGCISQLIKPAAGANVFTLPDYKAPNVCTYAIDLTQTDNFTSINFNTSIIDYSTEQSFFVGNATNNDTAFCFASIKSGKCEDLTINLTSVNIGTAFVINALNVTSKQEDIDFSQTARNFLSVGNCLLVVQKTS